MDSENHGLAHSDLGRHRVRVPTSTSLPSPATSGLQITVSRPCRFLLGSTAPLSATSGGPDTHMRTFTRLSLRPDDRLHHARRPFFNGENAQGLNCRAKSASSPMHLAWSPSDVASFPSHMARSGTWRLHSWVPWRERILHVNESGFCKFLHKQLADETSSCSTTSPLYGRSTKAH